MTMLRVEARSRLPGVKQGMKPSPLLRRNVKTSSASSGVEERVTVDMKDVTDSMRALQFIPPSLRNATIKTSKNSGSKD